MGLQQDERWDDFQRFDGADQLLFAELLGNGDEPAAAGDGEGPARVRLRPDMVVVEQFVERFVTEHFLDPNDAGAVDELVHQIPQLFGGLTLEELGLSRDQLAARIAEARRRDLTPQRIPVQPQQHRRELRRRLNEASRSVAGRMLQAMGLAPQAPNLVRAFPRLGAANNMGVLIRLMHREVNEAMGFPADSRQELSAVQLQAALDRLDDLGDRVQGRIREQRREGV